MMKLMSPQETRDSKAAETSLNIARTQEVRKALSEAQRQLREAEAAFDVSLSSQRLQFASMQAEESDKLFALSKEVSALEARRRELLLPIDDIRAKAENALREAAISMRLADERQEELDRMQEIFEERLDQASDTVQKAEEQERKAARKAKGIEAQEEMTRIGSARLSESIRAFISEGEKRDAELSERRLSLDRQGYTLDSRENLLRIAEEDMKGREILLADGRAALGRAWKELENKKNGQRI